MKNYTNNRVIAYMPKEEGSDQMAEMGAFRRGIWFYTNKLGLEFNLVLSLSFAFQVVIACYIGMKGMKTLPILTELDKLNSLIASIIAVITALFMQALLIAELAQVIWLRHPDKLKVRLQAGSIWWWLMLFALIVSTLINFLLLFLSVTGKDNLGEAWKASTTNQQSGFITLLLCLLSFLTMLRCASVMKTATSAEIKKEVREKLEAIATEMLLDAGEATRTQAMTVWANLNVNPTKFLPLQDTVLKLLSEQYPDIVPAEIIGDSWGYDFGGNALARVPPALHHALMQTRHRAVDERLNNLDYLWKQPPSALAEMIAYNLEAFGSPKYIDATNPEQPRFLTQHRVNLDQFEPATYTETEAEPITEAKSEIAIQEKETLSEGEIFAKNLKPAERVQFGLYLSEVIFPARNNGRVFPTNANVSIYACFDLVDLQWYLKYYRSQPSV
jgi:hypothetical protein